MRVSVAQRAKMQVSTVVMIGRATNIIQAIVSNDIIYVGNNKQCLHCMQICSDLFIMYQHKAGIGCDV